MKICHWQEYLKTLTLKENLITSFIKARYFQFWDPNFFLKQIYLLWAIGLDSNLYGLKISRTKLGCYNPRDNLTIFVPRLSVWHPNINILTPFIFFWVKNRLHFSLWRLIFSSNLCFSTIFFDIKLPLCIRKTGM